jgi:hypothetical protein
VQTCAYSFDPLELIGRDLRELPPVHRRAKTSGVVEARQVQRGPVQPDRGARTICSFVLAIHWSVEMEDDQLIIDRSKALLKRYF